MANPKIKNKIQPEIVSEPQIKKPIANKAQAVKKIKERKQKKISRFYSWGLGEEKEYFVENLAMLVGSGMGILQALAAIKAELRAKRMKKIITFLEDEINAGSNLWRALQEVNIFSGQVVSLIKIGEEAGRLTENLRVVSLQQQKERIFRSKIRAAMTYPIIVMSLTVVIGISITWFILPKLSKIFSELKVELPLLTKILISFGDFLGKNGSIAVPLFLLTLFILVYLIFFFPKSKVFGQFILFHFPGVKKLIQETEIARFGFILGTLLDAGLPIIDALESLGQSASFSSYKKMYNFLKTSVAEGNSFQKSFSLYSPARTLIPIPIQQMIVAGEQSGRLSEILIKIGENFEVRLDDTTKNLTVILEPILLIIIWFGVVAVALAIILPIYSLIGGLNVNPENTVSLPPAPSVQTMPVINNDLATSTLNNLSPTTTTSGL